MIDGPPSELCFSQRDVVLVPAEAIGKEGIGPAYRAQAEADGRLSSLCLDTLSESLATHFRRRRLLTERAPDWFLPPRALNYCVVVEPLASRPYFEPFVEASALLYASDFETPSGGMELGCFSLLLAELLGQVGTPGKALLASLGYLVSLSDEEANALTVELARTRRPDEGAFHALGAEISHLRNFVFHENINVPSSPTGTLARIKGTGLWAERAVAGTLGRLVMTFDTAARTVADDYLSRASLRSGTPSRDVADMLVRWKPRVVVALGDLVLWHPKQPDDVARLEGALDGIGDAIGKSLEKDLLLVDEASRRMRALLAEPDSMRIPIHSIDEGGGVYLRHEDALIAYDLEQPGLDARREPGPAFHDLLLAARVAHEWGHVAVENGVVRVADPSALEEAKREIAQALRDVARHVDASLREEVELELREIAGAGEDLGELPLARIEDYSANLLMRYALRPAELDAYVRNNVRPLLKLSIRPLRKLARFAYEAQYLGLGTLADPWGYFMAVTYFREEMIDGGIVDEVRARSLFAAVGHALRAYAIDRTKLAREIDDREIRFVG